MLKKAGFMTAMVLAAAPAWAQHGTALDTVTVRAAKQRQDVQMRNGTDGTTLYAGKKNELINLDGIQANTSTTTAGSFMPECPA